MTWNAVAQISLFLLVVLKKSNIWSMRPDVHPDVKEQMFTLLISILAGIGARFCAGRWLRLRAAMEPGTTSATGEIDLVMGDRTL